MGLEDRPEDVGHGEDDADEGNIRQGTPLLPLPEQGAAVATAWAAPRFTGVVEDLLSGGGGVDLASQGRGSAHAYLAEVLADCVAHGGVVPVLPGKFEDLAQRTLGTLGFRARRVFGGHHGWSSPCLVSAWRNSRENSRTLPGMLTSSIRTASFCSGVIAASAPTMR